MQNCFCKAFANSNVAGIISETKLVKVSLHMLTANPIIDAINSTFAVIAPKSFYCIGICTTIYIDAVPVVNNMMLIHLIYHSIPLPFVRI